MSENSSTEIQFHLREHELLAAHCRFHVGGAADYFTTASTSQQLIAALRFARERQLKYFVYAGGSNLFFDDAGFRGLVAKLANGGISIDSQQQLVSVGAGYDLGQLVRELAEHDLGGIEFLGNIPGSVGGAVVGNAGCYGRSISQVLVSAEIYDIAQDQPRAVEPPFFEFAYRHSRLKQDASYVLLNATLRVQPRDGVDVLGEVDGELSVRLRKHPHTAWCAGSFFKNPSPEYPAWRAISDAGMADSRVGDAMLSPLHANFLINAGQATSGEIIELVRMVQRGVYDKLGIALTPEVRYVSPTGITELSPLIPGVTA